MVQRVGAFGLSEETHSQEAVLPLFQLKSQGLKTKHNQSGLVKEKKKKNSNPPITFWPNCPSPKTLTTYHEVQKRLCVVKVEAVVGAWSLLDPPGDEIVVENTLEAPGLFFCVSSRLQDACRLQKLESLLIRYPAL